MHSKRLADIHLSQIVPNRFQPRIHFDDAKIESLAKSIMTYGVLEPIIVRPLGEKYEIIAGERRFKASKLANKSTIPAIIVDFDDKESIELALLENIQRQELTAIEEAIAYRRILDMGQITQEELAKKTGKSQPTIANKMRLLALDDETQDALINHKISERHARSLLKLVGTGKELGMLERIISERLTVRDTDREIAKLLEQKESAVDEKTENFFAKSVEKIEEKEKLSDDIELQISKIEEALEKMKEEKGENKFMDIEKIMQEAQDINVSEEPKDLNKFVTTPSPYDTIFGRGDQQPQQINDIAGILDNDVPEERNKFINNVQSEETEEKNAESLHPTVTFDNVFNSTFDVPEFKVETVAESADLPIEEIPSTFIESNNSVDFTEQPNNEFESVLSEEMPFETSIYESDSPVNLDPENQENTSVEVISSPVIESAEVPEIETSVSSMIEKPLEIMDSEIPEFTSTIAESAPNFETNIPDSAPSLDKGPTVPEVEIPSASSFNMIESLDFPETSSIENITDVDSMPAIPTEKDFSKVIDIIKECSDKIKELGYEINTNEFDLSNLYQVTIIINK